MKKKILTILGTRPELIKMFPIIDKLDKSFYNKLVWSGQHYDFSMVKQNFQDLKVRKPNVKIKILKLYGLNNRIIKIPRLFFLI